MKQKTRNILFMKKKLKADNVTVKLIIDMVAFLVLLILGTILLNKSLQFEAEKLIRYNEKSNLDYKVYLKENDFYEDKYLDKDMLYVASLIDKVAINFDYVFKSDEKVNIDFDYSVIAKLTIENETGTKAYFEKLYTLVDNKQVEMRDTDIQTITEQVNVDYPYYNALANNFKSKYGVAADSKLTIYMIVDKKNAEDSDFILDSSKTMNVSLPLSEKAVDISMDYKDINGVSNIVKTQKMKFGNYLLIGLSVVFIILSILMMIRSIRNTRLLYPTKSEYEKKVAKILKEYDRLIAESNTLMSFDGKEIIKINKFTELLDIHDNLQLPIMYYEVKKKELSYFYITYDNIVYLLKIDARAMNDKN